MEDFGVTMGATAVFGFLGRRFRHRYVYILESRLYVGLDCRCSCLPLVLDEAVTFRRLLCQVP